MKRTIVILSLAFVMTAAAFGQAASKQQPTGNKLSKQQLMSLIATAKTPAEHQRIADYYNAKALDFLAQSKEHQEMAEQYKKNVVTSSSKYAAGTVNHCEYLAKSLKDDATQMQELAQEHEQMAKDAQGN
jgi:hypothetical protein